MYVCMYVCMYVYVCVCVCVCIYTHLISGFAIFSPSETFTLRGQKKVHSVKLHDVYSSPYIIRVIKVRRMRWAGHVAHMRRE
jgi:hypothetical protein